MIAALIVAITLRAAAPLVTCEHQTVSYRFVGHVGDQFTYAGDQYTVPARGWIEITRSPGVHVYVAVDGGTFAIDEWPIDEFGTRHVAVRVFYINR